MEQKVAIIIYSKCVTINSKLKFVKYMYVKENILAWRGYWINSLYKVRSTFLFPWLAHLFLPHQAVGQSGPFPKGLDPLDYLSGSVFLDPLIINKKRGIKSNQILLWLNSILTVKFFLSNTGMDTDVIIVYVGLTSSSCKMEKRNFYEH